MSGIINLSEMATLAIHSMILIAQKEQDLINVKEIAKETSASEFHLSKILQRLVRAGFIRSVRGPKGGFKLNLSPDEISFYDIFETVEGPINVKKCPTNCNLCSFRHCIFDDVLDKANDEIVAFLKKKHLSHFISTKLEN
ncbi:Rrf2 family transcriptional regulator [Serpentinicella sp. ANB-PHB4]|uniref:RrF2 family transcriptional regulator n=1 Tax=Serpentinicella sp. ANB-PHB4 TaxID=3074076 RepID=UPI00285F0C8C|nr:Rrf2 family transcriptional regulator [Serpentinicella sp. ANB-PHB4]MDR5659579.1 Rrf2 family transcriptional regulator [Serpentinicella sp. ANB-PHB4]